MCWTRPREGDAAAASAAAATDGVEAREGTRRRAGEDEEEDEAAAAAIEWVIGEGITRGAAQKSRRRCCASGAALGATLPGNDDAPVATLARRGATLSFTAMFLFFGTRRKREEIRERERERDNPSTVDRKL